MLIGHLHFFTGNDDLTREVPAHARAVRAAQQEGEGDRVDAGAVVGVDEIEIGE
jgi:hypothetical protein